MPSDPTCPGVLRILGAGGDSCSLGRHCEANALRSDHDAYRRAHARCSDPSLTVPAGAPSMVRQEESTLMDAIVDAMERLARINPPTE